MVVWEVSKPSGITEAKQSFLIQLNSCWGACPPCSGKEYEFTPVSIGARASVLCVAAIQSSLEQGAFEDDTPLVLVMQGKRQ